MSVLEGGYSDGALVYGVSSHVGAMMGLGAEETKYRVLKPSTTPAQSVAAGSKSTSSTTSKAPVAEAAVAPAAPAAIQASTSSSSAPVSSAQEVEVASNSATAYRTRSKTGAKAASPSQQTPKASLPAQPFLQPAQEKQSPMTTPSTPHVAAVSLEAQQPSSQQKSSSAQKRQPGGSAQLPPSPASSPDDLPALVTPQRQPSQTHTLVTPPSPTPGGEQQQHHFPTQDDDDLIDVE